MALEAKGTVVKYISEFVRSEYPEKFEYWLKQLPASSRAIMSQSILATEWYDIEDSIVLPTKQLAKVLNCNERALAFESGRYSAEKALGGIYRVFVAIANPRFVISRAATMFNTFYRPAKISVPYLENRLGAMRVENFPVKDPVLNQRIAGWIQVAIEKSGGKNVEVTITSSTTRGDAYSEFKISWE